MRRSYRRGPAIIGAVVGALASLGATWLAHWLSTRSERALDDKRRERLKAMLSGDKYEWRSLDTLASAIGADHLKTASLLIDIDARASATNSGNWALISRKPFPADMQPDI